MRYLVKLIFFMMIIGLHSSNVNAQKSICLDFFVKTTVDGSDLDSYKDLESLLLNKNSFYFSSENEYRLFYLNEQQKMTRSYLSKPFSEVKYIENTNGQMIRLDEIGIHPDLVQFSADGKQIRITNYGSNSHGSGLFLGPSRDRIFSTEDGSLLRDFKVDENKRIVEISENFKAALVRNEDGSFTILDLSQPTIKSVSTVKVDNAVLSENGKYIILKQGRSQSIHSIHREGLKLILTTTRPWFENPFEPSSYIAQKTDIAILQTSNFRATVFDLNSGKKISDFPLMKNYKSFITPDGKYLLLTKKDKFIIRNLDTGLKVKELSLQGIDFRNSRGFLRWTRFSSDSQYLGFAIKLYRFNSDIEDYKFIVNFKKLSLDPIASN